MPQIRSLSTENKFKKTEIGEIPVDWEVSTINSIGILGRGRVISQKEIASHPGSYPVFSSQSKNQGILGYLDTYDFEGEYVTWTTDGAYAGTVFYRNGRFSCTNVCGTIKAKDEHLIDMQFLSYAISTRTKRYVSYVGNPKLMNNAMAEVSFVRPPLAVQKKIAEILSSVDHASEKIGDVMEKTKQLKKGLMQQLLTRGIRHKQFKQTEIGEIPTSWPVARIRDVCEKPQYGYTASAKDKPVGPKLLRITDIQDGEVDWSNVPYCECPESLKKEYLLRPGDILFARTGATTGKSYLIKECPEAVFASYLIRVATKENMLPTFLFLVFNSSIYWRQLGQQIGGSAQGGVNASALAELKVPVPPKTEQTKISALFSSTDEDLQTQTAQKTSLENLKKGLMQVLLTGKMRVRI